MDDGMEHRMRLTEAAKLDRVEHELWEQYTSGSQSSAQQLNTLSEMRKVIELRSILMGLIDPRKEDYNG